jgi:Fur family peroxide stress response transcriptional regulator
MVKRSRQRDAIKARLTGRDDHPTAETLYNELKEDLPSLSLATVYRNLHQLESWGEISTINLGGATRYDYDTRPHSHFYCTECGRLMDLDDDNERIVRMGQERFPGRIMGCASNYFGLCPDCMKDPEKSN